MYLIETSFFQSWLPNSEPAEDIDRVKWMEKGMLGDATDYTDTQLKYKRRHYVDIYAE